MFDLVMEIVFWLPLATDVRGTRGLWIYWLTSNRGVVYKAIKFAVNDVCVEINSKYFISFSKSHFKRDEHRPVFFAIILPVFFAILQKALPNMAK